MNAAQHEDVSISVDTDGDGQAEEEFNDDDANGTSDRLCCDMG